MSGDPMKDAVQRAIPTVYVDSKTPHASELYNSVREGERALNKFDHQASQVPLSLAESKRRVQDRFKGDIEWPPGPLVFEIPRCKHASGCNLYRGLDYGGSFNFCKKHKG